jgi:hypothetical protein
LNYQIELLKCKKGNDNVSFKCLDWSKYDKEDFSNIYQNIDIILAADVIYDNDLTLYLMNTIYKLMISSTPNSKSKTTQCFISNEKRCNFSTSTQTITDGALNFFEQCILDLDNYEDTDAKIRFTAKRVNNLDQMPAFIKSYQRSSHLFIWKIESILI